MGIVVPIQPWSLADSHLVEWTGLRLDGWMERRQGAQDGKHKIDDDLYDDFPEVKR